MAKLVLFSEDARRKMHAGIAQAARAVKATLGPRGRNVILERSYGGPRITNDGVSIAKEISFKDKFENMGAELVKEVAGKTNDLAGDGTTTTVVLFESLVELGMEHASRGANVMALRAGMERGAEAAVAELKKLAKPIAGDADVKQVATVSAESAELGTRIADAIKKVGQDGVVTVEESQGTEMAFEITEGMEIEKGYASPYLITSPERMEAEYRDVPILLTDKKISNIQDILPLLEKLAQSGRKELVIIADDIEGDALATFIVNRLKGTFNALAIKAPGFGERKKELLHDIAVVVGGQVISEEVGLKFETATLSMLGKAARVTADKDRTVIVGGKGKKADIESRVESLKTQLSQTESKYDKEQLAKRIAKLAGGVAVIKVGAATETEMKYLKDKVDDAVKATKAAMEEGVIPGGGTALAKVAKKLRDSAPKNLSGDEKAGFETVVRALEAPLRQIAQNAGKEDGYLIVSKVQEAKGNAGYDAMKDEMLSDMLDAGIIDPAKVARSGIEHAVSAAAIFLTTEVAIAEEPEEKKPRGHSHEEDY